MNVYTITGFRGHWPVGTSAVIVAPDRHQAKHLLEAALARAGLSQTIREDDFKLLETEVMRAEILQDGDY